MVLMLKLASGLLLFLSLGPPPLPVVVGCIYRTRLSRILLLGEEHDSLLWLGEEAIFVAWRGSCFVVWRGSLASCCVHLDIIGQNFDNGKNNNKIKNRRTKVKQNEIKR